MDYFERSLILGKNYIGRRADMAPYLHRMPQLHELKLAQTANTSLTCRVCRGVNYGNGMIVNHHSNGHMDYERCPACHGSKIMPKTEGGR